jgi:tRNA-specific 2-thiouridylase
MRERVAVAMSGGVDSSVAAALLKEKGYEVIGLTMQIWPREEPAEPGEKYQECCGLEAATDAKKVSFKLGIPHYVVNFQEVFFEKVVKNFCLEYLRGRTPNPCIRCNEFIKFEAFFKKAKELGADFIATGHYARIEFAGGRFLLKKGLDFTKDQSYVLYPMTQEQLKHTLLPLGKLRKEEVRKIARRLNLPVAEKRESQEICFIPDNKYGEFIRKHFPEVAKPGPIFDREGRILGEHKGFVFYTVGQRKGIGISAGRPFYLASIDPKKHAVIVGGEEELFKTELIASGVNFIPFEKLEQPLEVRAKIRYRHSEAQALLTPLNEKTIRVKFKEPQRAITPGQAVVFYKEDLVIGGGTIEFAAI